MLDISEVVSILPAPNVQTDLASFAAVVDLCSFGSHCLVDLLYLYTSKMEMAGDSAA